MSIFEDHRSAFMALLNGAGKPAAIGIYNDKIPTTVVPPYVRVYFSANRPPGADGNALDGTSKTLMFRAICHCVGGNDTAALAVAQWVETALLDVRPTVAGRSSGLIRQDSALDPNPDESTGQLVVDVIQTYRLTTEP